MGTHPIFESDFDCLTEKGFRKMEWDNLDEIMPNEITKFDQNQISKWSNQLAAASYYFSKTKDSLKRNAETLKNIIDKLGWGSARAQGLGHTITSFDRFSYGDRLSIYIIRDKPSPRNQPLPPEAEDGEDINDESSSHTTSKSLRYSPRRGQVYGFIKIGHKPLFVMDLNGNQLEVNPLCVLDFYVLEDYQRCGYGKKLFEYMLKDQLISNPGQLAIDRPSVKFKSFLRKHYGLSRNIPQVNNFVIYEGFFKFNQVRRNRNRLMDDLQEKRAKSHYQDRRNLLNRQRSSELRYNKSESGSLRHNYATPTQTHPHKINNESSLPRLVPPVSANKSTISKHVNVPESVMKVTTEKSEPIIRSKTLNGCVGGGGPRIEHSKTMLDVNNFNPNGKKESAVDQHYSKYINQWAPRSRKSNHSSHRINTAFNIFGVRSNFG